MLTASQLNALQDSFAATDSILITAGAGMGVDSGLPDFRGNQGMWQAYPALGQQRLDFTQIANPTAFKRQPRLAWGFYGHRLKRYRETQPHSGFDQLREWLHQQRKPYFIFTSNVDGQFQKAGFDADLIYECHGSIHYLQCTVPCQQVIYPADALQPEIDVTTCHWQQDLPTCPHCGGLARPNILMFNDWHWIDQRQQQQYKRLSAWLKQHRPLVIEMGAGTAVPTVRTFGEQFAPDFIRINPREPQLPRQGGVALPCGSIQGINYLINHLT